mgnify:CR=1 FL=1
MQTTLSFGPKGLMATAGPPPLPSAASKKRALSPPSSALQGASKKHALVDVQPQVVLSETEKRKAILSEIEHQRRTGISTVVHGSGLKRAQNYK